MEHAFLAPSAAHIWGRPDGCPAYPRMAAAYPEDRENPKAREGDAAHFYLTETLKGNTVKVGDVAPNGYPITEEMVDCAEDLLSDVRSWGLPDICLAIEQHITMPTIHPTLNFGRTDIGGVNFDTRTLYVRDYKFGHMFVDVWDNEQTINYGVGLFRHFGIVETDIPHWAVNMGIFQPRCYHPDGPVKTQELTGLRFLELADSLANCARKAADPDAEMHTGHHCNFCPAVYNCPAARAVGGVSIDLSMQALPHELTPETAGLIWKHLDDAEDRLKALKSGVEAQIEDYIRVKKVRVPGVDLVQSQGREEWTKPVEEVFLLGDAFGKELRQKKAITPKQARDLGIDETVISAYSTRRSGKLKVAAMADNTAVKAFK